MNRRSMFGLLAGATAATTAKASASEPLGDLVIDCREDSRLHPFRVLVDGVEIPHVWYVNFTRGFVRSYGETIQQAKYGFQKWPSKLYYMHAKDGHCWLRRCGDVPASTEARVISGESWQPYRVWWEEVPLPDDCEVLTLSEGVSVLSRTIRGRVELQRL